MTPVDPTQETYPAFLREPAKLIGWIVAAVVGTAALALEILTAVTDVVPERARGHVQAVVAIATTVFIVATRVQAILTRARVYAPASLDRYAARGHEGQGIGTPPVDPDGIPN